MDVYSIKQQPLTDLQGIGKKLTNDDVRALGWGREKERSVTEIRGKK